MSLPLALLSAGALGFALAADATSAGEAADAAGLPGLMTDALSSSAAGIEGSRWWTGIGGLVLLLWASLTLLRALRTVDALAWQQPIPRLRHAARATLVFVTVLISVAAFTGAADLDSLSWVPWKVFANLGLLVSYGSLWLILSAWLPHREARLGDLVPGAALFAAGTKAFHLLVVVWVAPRFESGSALYGMFGMITALLLALYVFGAIVVLSAVLNAVLWERRHERSGAGAPDPAA